MKEHKYIIQNLLLWNFSLFFVARLRQIFFGSVSNRISSPFAIIPWECLKWRKFSGRSVVKKGWKRAYLYVISKSHTFLCCVFFGNIAFVRDQMFSSKNSKRADQVRMNNREFEKNNAQHCRRENRNYRRLIKIVIPLFGFSATTNTKVNASAKKSQSQILSTHFNFLEFP